MSARAVAAPDIATTPSAQTAAPAQASALAVWGALAIVYVVWGSTYLAIRFLIQTIPPLLGAGARFTLAGALMLAAVALRSGRARIHLRRGEWAAAALVGTLLAAGGNGLVTVAERHVPSGLAALILASIPLWIVLMRALAGDRANARTLIGVLAGLAGIALLVLPGHRPDGATTAGLLIAVAAAVSWALGSTLSARVALPTDPIVSTGAQMLCGGLVLLVAGGAAGEGASVHPDRFSTNSIVAFVYLVVAGSLIAFTAYVWLLQHAPVSKVSTYAFVNPVVAVFLGWVVLDETVSAMTLVAAAVIVVSVAAIVRQPATPAARGRGMRDAWRRKTSPGTTASASSASDPAR